MNKMSMNEKNECRQKIRMWLKKMNVNEGNECE